jgi:hypothetical protein
MLEHHFRQKVEGVMFWWVLAAVVLVVPILFFGLYLWASSDPEIDREIARERARERFQAEQELRWLRRSGPGKIE